jgi:hypothetical protein
MFWTKSENAGKSFDEAAKLGLGTWPIDACPMDGGGIAISTAHLVNTAWRRDSTVYLATSDQASERRLGSGEQPSIACSSDGPYVVWLEKRGGVAMLLRPNSPNAQAIGKHVLDPVIVASPTADGPVIAAWESVDGDNHAIQVLAIESGN